MKGVVVKALFYKRSHTGKALYLLSDLILIHAELGHGPCVVWWKSLLEQPHKLPHSILYIFLKERKKHLLSGCSETCPGKVKHEV